MPEISVVVHSRNNFRTAAKTMGAQTLRTLLCSDSGKKSIQSYSNKICITKQSLAKRHFYKQFSMIMSSNFRYEQFLEVSGNLGGKVPGVDNVLLSHEQKTYPTTSFDENCIECEFQTDWKN